MLMNETDHLENFSIKQLRAAMGALGLPQKSAKTPEEALSKSYQFWNTQPVPKLGELIAKFRCGLVFLLLYFFQMKLLL